ncbi:hypothetical protein ACP2AV_15095 [Aliiroseovarius sp. PTFE2010]|uniref:hypothetical protein n=1 Tax=Aliiroseovarius sp. PTFE2010 TaxID=3417190 RepID=UPI003CF40723
MSLKDKSPVDHLDPVDKVVDEVVADPEKAEKLKKVLHDELDKHDRAPKARYARAESDEVDDLFENMPV